MGRVFEEGRVAWLLVRPPRGESHIGRSGDGRWRGAIRILMAKHAVFAGCDGFEKGVSALGWRWAVKPDVLIETGTGLWRFGYRRQNNA